MHFLIVISLFISLIYPIILSLLGMEWTSSSESPLYMYSVLGINGIVIIYIIFYEFLNSKKAKGTTLPYIIPVVVAIFYIFDITGGTSLNLGLANRSFTLFIAFSVVGIFSATYCCRYGKLPLIIKNFELLMFICSIALILALPKIAQSAMNMSVNIGGGNHQVISYSAACAFGTIFCSLKKTPHFTTYKIFTFALYRRVALIILILLPIVCIIGGGRGGMVLLLVNLFLCTYFVSGKSVVKLAMGLLLVCGIVYVIANYVPMGGLEVHIQKGLERSFAFISEEGIDMENGSSGRDFVYDTAMKLIDQKPILGYGLFTQYSVCGYYIHQPYSHNLFLEVTLQLGIIGIIILTYTLYMVIRRLLRMLSQKGCYIYLVPFATYPFILLQFSGTYMFTPSFWFIIIVALCYKYSNQNKKIIDVKTVHAV